MVSVSASAAHDVTAPSAGEGEGRWYGGEKDSRVTGAEDAAERDGPRPSVPLDAGAVKEAGPQVPTAETLPRQRLGLGSGPGNRESRFGPIL